MKCDCQQKNSANSEKMSKSEKNKQMMGTEIFWWIKNKLTYRESKLIRMCNQFI
ncbi:hypothetical protein VAS14_01796 [Photobacterium angustum S14]|uniref:Uncharacterized protein n=1 Tax=Photobacterium angustum (strain S14 / CCUG 15956) TaxID=314292 RepID=Q1ZQ86_PHOAS|nr:hypothetical protein VAS14_01796 [Photobacterium angustum S14]